MSVLCDTSVIVDVLRGLPRAVAYANGLAEPPTCSEITRVEVLRGLQGDERGRTERLFEALRWVAVDELVARRAGEFGRQWGRSHRGIATADLIIAATADVHRLDLATLNLKHFPMVPGRRPPYEP